MTNMKWTYVSGLNEDEPTWIIVDSGISKGHLLGPETLADDIVKGLNLLDASKDKGMIQAMQDQTFDIIFTPSPKRRVRK